MLHIPTKKILPLSLPSSSRSNEIALAATFEATLVSRIELLARSLIREYKTERSGVPRQDFFKVAAGSLFTDLTQGAFSLFHQDCKRNKPSDFQPKTFSFEPISVSDFEKYYTLYFPNIR